MYDKVLDGLSPRYIGGARTASQFTLGTLVFFISFFVLLSLIGHVFFAVWAPRPAVLPFGLVICVGCSAVFLRHVWGAHLRFRLKFASERRWDMPGVLKRQQLNEIWSFPDIVFSLGMSFFALSTLFADVFLIVHCSQKASGVQNLVSIAKSFVHWRDATRSWLAQTLEQLRWYLKNLDIFLIMSEF